MSVLRKKPCTASCSEGSAAGVGFCGSASTLDKNALMLSELPALAKLRPPAPENVAAPKSKYSCPEVP